MSNLNEFTKVEIWDLMDAVREQQHKANSLKQRCTDMSKKQDYELESKHYVELWQKLEKVYYSK